MANLYGTGINQVPTNGMLGNLAFQDKAYLSVDRVGIGSTFVDSGTANQNLQVTGGAYVSGNLGVGVTNPASNTQVAIAGTLGISEVGNSGSRTLLTSSTNGFILNHNDNSQIQIQNQSSPVLTYNRTNQLWNIPSGIPLLVGAATSTGTASQPLQITGGSYVSGNLGVGATNPTNRLEVIGNTWLNNSSGDTGARAQGLTVSVAPGNNFTPGTDPGDPLRNTTFAVKGATRSAIIALRNIDNGNAFYDLIADGSSNSFYIQKPGTSPALSINNSNNIGVGWTNPLSKFSINGSGTAPSLTLPDATNPRFSVGFGCINVSGVGQRLDFFAGDSGSNTSNLTSSHLRMSLTATGNFGIGTTNPASILHTSSSDGTIRIASSTTNDSGRIILMEQNLNAWVIDGTRVGANFVIQDGWNGGTQNPSTKLAISPSGQVLINTETVTGTSSQLLQVNSGAYVSGNTGIGTTNPLQNLHIQGNLLVAAGSSTAQHITQRAYELNNGTLSWEGSAGQLFSITNNLTSGSIFSVNDVSGIPSIDVNANGTVQIAPFGGNAGIGTTNPTSRLQVVGDARISGVVTAASFVGNGSGLTNITAVSIGTAAPSTPSAGNLWYNSDLGRTFVYYNDGDSAQWVDAAPFNVSSVLPTLTPGRTDTTFTATAGQTVFNVSYTVGYVDVYLNGVRLTGTEYSASNGTSITLVEGASAGDIVSVVETRTGIGATGPTGPTGSGGPLQNITNTSTNAIHYPVFAVGGGTTTPFINTTSNFFSFNPSSGTLSVNQLNVVGVATATDFNSTSDINLKTNVKTIEDPLSKVLQIKGVSFDWIESQQSSAGVIAQDVEKIMPEIVKESEGHKTLNYNGLIGLLVEAVKEQNETIQILKEKINTLEERLN